METLFAILLAGVVALLVCTVCYGAVLVRLFVVEGWTKALLAVVCPPYAYAWGWRHRQATRWMAAWTCAAVLVAGGLTFLQLQMG